MKPRKNDIIIPIISDCDKQKNPGNYHFLELIFHFLISENASQRQACIESSINFIIELIKGDGIDVFWKNENGEHLQIQFDNRGEKTIQEYILNLIYSQEAFEFISDIFLKKPAIIPQAIDVPIDLQEEGELLGNFNLTRIITQTLDDPDSYEYFSKVLERSDIDSFSRYYKKLCNEGIRFLERIDGQYFEASDEKAIDFIKNLFIEIYTEHFKNLDSLIAEVFENPQNTSEREERVKNLLSQLEKEITNAKPCGGDGRERPKQLAKMYVDAYQYSSKGSKYRGELMDLLIELLKKEGVSLITKNGENLFDTKNSRKLRKYLGNLLRTEAQKLGIEARHPLHPGMVKK